MQLTPVPNRSRYGPMVFILPGQGNQKEKMLLNLQEEAALAQFRGGRRVDNIEILRKIFSR